MGKCHIGKEGWPKIGQKNVTYYMNVTVKTGGLDSPGMGE